MKNFKKGFVKLLVIVVVAILAVGGGIYFFTKDKVQKISGTNASKNFQISEFGVSFSVGDDIKDLSYFLSVDKKTAYFTTKTLYEASGKDCGENDGPLGNISINQQNLIDREIVEPTETDTFHKINGVWVYYVSPQSTCSEDKNIQDLQTKQMNALKNAFKNVQSVN